MSVIRWEEPPHNGRIRAEARAAQWQPVADELRQRPGQWAVIEENYHSAVAGSMSYVKQGCGPFAPRGSFETKSRTLPDDGSRTARKVLLYARYVGEVKS